MKYNLLNKLKIKYKILVTAALAGVFILTLLFLFTNYISSLKEQQKQIALLDKLKSDVELLLDIQKEFLFIELNNSDFLETGRSSYIEQFTKQVQKCRQMDSLSEFSFFSNKELLIIKNIQNQLDNNKSEFEKISEMVRMRGGGNLGQVATVTHSMERLYSSLTQSKDFSFLSNKLNELTQTEASYFQKPDIKKKETFRKDINFCETELQTLFLATDTNSTRYKKIKNDFYSYRENVERLFETDTEIGFLENETSLINSTKKGFDIIQNHLNTLSDSIDRQHFAQNARKQTLIFLFIFFLTATLAFTFYEVYGKMLIPIEKLKNYVFRLSRGQLPEKVKLGDNDEITEITEEVNILTDNLKRTREFSIAVGQGNFETQIEVFNNEGELGNALREMRTELFRVAKQREDQIKEEQHRNWINGGIGKFNDILRQHSLSFTELAYTLISNLVDYIEASQGAFFFLNDDDKDDVYLTLVATYAYSKRKYLDKKIRLGEDLVGTCAIERKTIYLDEIPANYLEIRSGLGQSAPTNILLLPLKSDEELLGVIEISSFKIIEAYKIDFVEKIAEAIAAAFVNLRAARRTEQLLETSQRQAQELAEKEEEMRQNVEELRATQEASAKKEAEASGFVSAVNHTIIRADYNVDGTLEYANSKFLEITGYSLREMKGLPVTKIIEPREIDSFEEDWRRVAAGGRHIEREMRFITRNGLRWFLATYTSIKNPFGKVNKILYLGIDIHDQKNINLNYEGEFKAIARSVIKAEFSPDGILENANELFLNTLGYEWFEIKEKNILFFIQVQDREIFKKSWDSIKMGAPLEMQQKVFTKNDTVKWLQIIYSPVKDFDTHVYKVIFIAQDITEQKEMEVAAQLRTEELQRQEKILRENMDEMLKMQTILSKKDEELRVQIDLLNHKNREQLQEIITKDAEMRGQLEAINKTNALIEYNTQGNILTANEIFCSLFEYQLDEILGKNHRILVSSQYAKTTDYRKFWSNLIKGSVEEGEFLHRTKNGEEVYIKGVYYPILNQNGQVYKIMELAFDITESKHQEAEIKGQLEAINRTNALIEYKLDGTIIHVNTIFCLLMGYSETDLIGKQHQIFLDAAYKKSDDYAVFWERLKQGKYQQGEFKRITKSGEEIYIKGIYNPMFDKNGKVYKVLELAFNITESKQLQLSLMHQTQQLKDQEELTNFNVEEMKATQEEMAKKDAEMNSLIQSLNASTYCMELNLDGNIINISELYAELIKKPRYEITGTHHKDYLAEGEFDELNYNLFWTDLKEGKTIHRTTRRMINSQIYWFEETYSPIYDNESEVVKIFNIAFDITKMKTIGNHLDSSTI